MPRKIRDLVRDLLDAGFEPRPAKRGKGDHQMYWYPGNPRATVNLDGRPGDDAHDYQEKQVKKAIQESQRNL